MSSSDSDTPVVAVPVEEPKKVKKSKKSKKDKKKKDKKRKAEEPVVSEEEPSKKQKKEKKKKSKKSKKDKKVEVVEEKAAASSDSESSAADVSVDAEAIPAPVVEEDPLAGLKKANKTPEFESAGGNNSGELQEITLTCRDCSEPFPFSVEDQQWHIDQGFDNSPSRCKPCQKAKKERMNGGPAPCYAFNDGNCDRGDNCRFAHGASGGGGGGGGYGSRPQGECYAFKEGNCTRGDGCRFSHGGAGGGGGGGGGSRPRGGCYAFKEGNCTRGDSCRFSHE